MKSQGPLVLFEGIFKPRVWVHFCPFGFFMALFNEVGKLEALSGTMDLLMSFLPATKVVRAFVKTCVCNYNVHATHRLPHRRIPTTIAVPYGRQIWGFILCFRGGVSIVAVRAGRTTGNV